MSTNPIDSPYVIMAGPDGFGGNRRADGDGYPGVIMANVLLPWRFPGAKPREDKMTGRKSSYPPYQLFAKCTILADEDSPFGATEDDEMIQAGYLGSAMPTDDGEKPKGASIEMYKKLDRGEAEMNDGEEDDLAAVFVLGVTADGKIKKDYKLPNSDYGQFITSIDRLLKNASEEELKAHGWPGWSRKQDCIVGLHLWFNLLPRDSNMGNRQVKVSNDPNARKMDFKVLCATALLDPVGKPAESSSVSVAVSSTSANKSAGKSTTTTAATSKSNGAESDDTEFELEELIVGMISDANKNGSKLLHGQIAAQIPPAFQGKDVNKAISLINTNWSKDAARPWIRKATGYELKES